MRYDYYCEDCGKVTSEEVMISEKPSDWSPPDTVDCSSCDREAKRTFGAAVSMQENRDQMKHIGASLSNARGVEFIGKDFPDVERKLDAEQKEISDIMDEPVTRHDVDAGYEQMEQLEEERGKPKGFYSGKREQVEVEAEIDGKIHKKKSAKKRGAVALKQEAEQSKVSRGA